MYRIKSLKSFFDISKISNNYKSWNLKNDENEVKLKTLLKYHNSRLDHIK